jgi:RNA methyltransferase, TrmH family
MVSKNQIKLITGLQQKKYRKEHQLFIVEGVKGIEELLNSDYELEHLFVTHELFLNVPNHKRSLISEVELKKISALTTANDCLALFKIPADVKINDEGLMVALDDIRDPGNLGTIIRLCDWFGIKQIICSEQTVDVYNPKVVQATMGSISRVNVAYLNLEEYLDKSSKTIFGTFMEGDDIYKNELAQDGIIVLGNEANGVSKPIENHVTRKITIPRFGDLQQTESLNVATATAIVLSEFKRNS